MRRCAQTSAWTLQITAVTTTRALLLLHWMRTRSDSTLSRLLLLSMLQQRAATITTIRCLDVGHIRAHRFGSLLSWATFNPKNGGIHKIGVYINERKTCTRRHSIKLLKCFVLIRTIFCTMHIILIAVCAILQYID